jgi:toxin YoeB
MGQFKLQIEELAESHIRRHLKSGDKASIKKIEKILIELTETPYNGIGNPEALKYELSGFWSRKINQKDRLNIQSRRRCCHRLCDLSHGTL